MDILYWIIIGHMLVIVYMWFRFGMGWKQTHRKMRYIKIIILLMLTLWSGYIIKQVERRGRIEFHRKARALEEKLAPVIAESIRKIRQYQDLKPEEKDEAERQIREEIAKAIEKEAEK